MLTVKTIIRMRIPNYKLSKTYTNNRWGQSKLRHDLQYRVKIPKYFQSENITKYEALSHYT